MLRNYLLAAAAIVLVLALGGASMAATTIISPVSGSLEISSFGEPDTQTYGQTFIAPTESRLDDWTFYLRDQGGTGNPRVAFYVMGWDGGKATGPVLFSSGMRIVDSLVSAPYKFDVGVDLVAGQQYVAFISASNYLDGSSDAGAMAVNNDQYSDGSFFILNHWEEDFSYVSRTNWSDFYASDYDAAFTANFSAPGSPAVPEPMALLLGGLGMGSLPMILRRRR